MAESCGARNGSRKGWVETMSIHANSSSTSSKYAVILHCVIWICIALLVGWWMRTGWVASDQSQTYPNRDIEIVVPYAAGGGSDTFARIIQQGLQEAEEFDQPLVIINQPGGIGTIGSREVKNSQPDGYKILCHHNAIITAKLAETVNYGPEAFEPIALTGEMSMVVLVRADSQIEDLQGLLEESARSESSIRFAANKGAPSYYAALQLEQSLQGADFTIVSSGGGADRYTKIIGGHLDAGIFSLSEYLDFLAPEGTPANRDIRAIAVLSPQRHESIPDVPTAVEAGIPVVLRNANYWWAPKGTPSKIIERIAVALENAMNEPTVVQELRRLRLDPTFAVGVELRDRLNATVENFEKVAVSQNVSQAGSLPRFDLYLGCFVLVLFALVTWEQIRGGAAGKVDDSEIQPVRQGRGQPLLALTAFGVVVFHVLAIQSGWLPLAITLVSLVLLLGILLSRHVATRKLWLVELSLLTGFGAQFIFSEILKISLP